MLEIDENRQRCRVEGPTTLFTTDCGEEERPGSERRWNFHGESEETLWCTRYTLLLSATRYKLLHYYTRNP